MESSNFIKKMESLFSIFKKAGVIEEDSITTFLQKIVPKSSSDADFHETGYESLFERILTSAEEELKALFEKKKNKTKEEGSLAEFLSSLTKIEEEEKFSFSSFLTKEETDIKSNLKKIVNLFDDKTKNKESKEDKKPNKDTKKLLKINANETPKKKIIKRPLRKPNELISKTNLKVRSFASNNNGARKVSN